MKIITVSGKARHGKDFTANVIADILQGAGHKVLVTHYADLLKFICRSMFGWNGEKDEEGRHILQYVGTDVVRKQNPNFWVDYMISVLKLFENEWEYVIIPDTRFPNEIDRLCENFSNVYSIKVIRPDFDNGLTEEAQAHPSEHALDDYKFDYTLYNHGDRGYINSIKQTLINIVPSNMRHGIGTGYWDGYIQNSN